MRFQTPLVPARLIRRYKRFLADVQLDDGREVTAHCPNPGAMTGLAEPGTRIWLEPNEDPRKKLRYGWRLTEIAGGHAIIDTSLANRIVGEALAAGAISALAGAGAVRAEVAYGTGSRVDFLLEGPAGKCFVEVKSVSLSRTAGLAEFPDTVTKRGAKHLGELAAMVGAGHRAVMLYLVVRDDCTAFTPAIDIDPAYGAAFAAARAAGVESLAIGCAISRHEITIASDIPLAVRPL